MRRLIEEKLASDIFSRRVSPSFWPLELNTSSDIHRRNLNPTFPFGLENSIIARSSLLFATLLNNGREHSRRSVKRVGSGRWDARRYASGKCIRNGHNSPLGSDEAPSACFLLGSGWKSPRLHGAGFAVRLFMQVRISLTSIAAGATVIHNKRSEPLWLGVNSFSRYSSWSACR